MSPPLIRRRLQVKTKVFVVPHFPSVQTFSVQFMLAWVKGGNNKTDNTQTVSGCNFFVSLQFVILFMTHDNIALCSGLKATAWKARNNHKSCQWLSLSEWCLSTQLNLSLSSGYDEMEAQFAWDDMTIRRTFIRKVWKCYARRATAVQTHSAAIALTQCMSSCRSMPFSWCSCSSQWPSSLSSHSGNYSSVLPYRCLSLSVFCTTLMNPCYCCLHSAPVRFFIQTHPSLYMAS